VESAAAAEFKRRFVAGVRALKVGDPADPETDVVHIGDPSTARRSIYQYE
jgi:acyl-CoA reductase-like NAD-dependent aldehyde dehydrogenase